MHQYLFPIAAVGNTLENQPPPDYQKQAKTVLNVSVHEYMIYLNENESPPAIKYPHKLSDTNTHTSAHTDAYAQKNHTLDLKGFKTEGTRGLKLKEIFLPPH